MSDDSVCLYARHNLSGVPALNLDFHPNADGHSVIALVVVATIGTEPPVSSEGIVGGFGDSTFQLNSSIAREQMESILYRYAEDKDYDVSARADLSAYSDQPSA